MAAKDCVAAPISIGNQRTKQLHGRHSPHPVREIACVRRSGNIRAKVALRP